MFYPFFNQNYFRAELVFLKQYYRYYFSRNLWLFSMGWSDSHFCLIALIISLCVVYILSFYLFSLSLHLRLILFYRPLCFLYTRSLIRFLLLPYVLSVSAPFPCSLILPDSVAFIFMIIQRHHWTAKSLLLPFLFLPFPLSLSLSFTRSLHFSPYWFIFFPPGFIFAFCN